MNTNSILGSVSLIVFSFVPAWHLSAEEPAGGSASAADSGSGVETRIISPINYGKPSPPAPEPERLQLAVKSSVTHKQHVVETPPMPGLPAPEGDINVTIQQVEDPGLPVVSQPLPALAPSDPAVRARLAELSKNYKQTKFVFISASVYDHDRTFFRCHLGRGQICGWSNLDFNHFSGFAKFQAQGADGAVRRYGLMMGISNENVRQRTELLAKHGRTYKPPEIPQLPDFAENGPAFVVTEGDADDKEAMELVEGMHNLYRIEGKRMEDAYLERVKAEEARRKFLLAHPQKPQDVIIRCWKRKPVKETDTTKQPEQSDENQ